MNNQPVDSNEESKKRDPDLVGAEIAIKRAARKAREKAMRAGAGVIVLKDGHIVEERQNTPVGE
ncbi:MAG: hypothetical protein WAM73_10695 [Desulfobacterales bacterium]